MFLEEKTPTKTRLTRKYESIIICHLTSRHYIDFFYLFYEECKICDFVLTRFQLMGFSSHRILPCHEKKREILDHFVWSISTVGSSCWIKESWIELSTGSWRVMKFDKELKVLLSTPGHTRVVTSPFVIFDMVGVKNKLTYISVEQI